MDPDMVDVVIRYIYTDYLDTDSNESLLESDIGGSSFEYFVRLWMHADFFQLPHLQRSARKHIVQDFADTAHDLWSFPLTNESDRRGYIPWILESDGKNLKDFNDSLFKVVELAYLTPGPRKLQKLLTACAHCMGCHLSGERLRACFERSPEFKEDMLQALARMRFDRDFANTMGDYWLEYKTPKELDGQWRCMRCKKEIKQEPQPGNGMVFDDYLMHNHKWCWTCSETALSSQVKALASRL